MRYMALVVFACFINNKDTGSRDFQAIDVKANSPKEVALKVQMVRHQYKNDSGEKVSWRLVDVFHVGVIPKQCKDMEEISGFIARKEEVFGKYSKIAPKKSYLTMRFQDKKTKSKAS